MKDLTGKKFGYLRVIKRVDVAGRPKWLCRCQCGKETVVGGGNLRGGITKSCGCYRRVITGNRARTHGKSHTPTYLAWNRMHRRCKDPRVIDYEHYGGRGIVVCERWHKFENFLEDMGERPDGLTLERVNNDGNYEISNCRWATRMEQANNTRRNHIVDTPHGQITVAQIARMIGVTGSCIRRRIKRGLRGHEILAPSKRRPCTTS